jgi:hypothetical protein
MQSGSALIRAGNHSQSACRVIEALPYVPYNLSLYSDILAYTADRELFFPGAGIPIDKTRDYSSKNRIQCSIKGKISSK